ncbi:response regulator receiver modulated diguanylate cyclase/phosphodiesterase [Pseudomonas sp. SJZ103]|uniref:putative bifunctional diguanylate cyclase/phosphodiesterase n=1 Tax=unclassified Pseudomonas TaxID=196821 RepID=UPI001039834D|nr:MULTISPECIES: GGDEF and EAL domain-containing protein [unclassified Pseudomonas]MBB6288324.1 diguanylate cyclase (GGDEF)-like protein [Pseudomonas sp. SJZ073]MBB6313296.1 diguanylate cyclase (GGDEF)-like protein [Pseudomonas sp. JAI120]TWC74821.1 response regulator receiver modulated diguanylate cyclase/phosphodiesterase [Pseudomonas sp. SJZ103]TWC93050.1 response regulator receiver modulated diguanylate cyclase/phosphodiesterase [Pseudomonas sp. SJZ094]
MTPDSGRANRRILIVDDTTSIHQDFRKILCADTDGEASLDTLEQTLFGTTTVVRQAFVLDSAYQGQEALDLVNRALAANAPYAMAFIDMRMPPGWDGLETIEQLWNVDPNLQIALCTAYSDYSFEAIEARLKYNDQLLILKKPFDHLEIRQMASALTWKWQLAQDAALKVIGLERTIEDRVQELLKVSHLLQYDALTELPNSTLLGDRLTQAIALGRRHDTQLAVMFIGLDRFKRINNALGYPVGDEVLQQVSQSLVAAVRASDSVFRYGSDEFVILLNDVQHPQQTQHIAQKVLKAISVTRHVAGHDLSVTASLGISLYPNDSSTAVELIKHAETAMHTTKERGPDDLSFYTEDMNLRAQHQQNLESAIRQALEHDEFALHYQPKLDLKTGRILGAEALIRWFQPRSGWVHPADFIPVAEDSGLIVPLTQWVLRHACEQAQAWRTMGLAPLRISVNISAIDFRQREFVDNLAAILKQTGLPPNQLELEITESVLMQNVDDTVDILNRIKAMGVRLALDDFGTGYSSLSYLRRFPIDVLKIDQSFVRGLHENSQDAQLISAIIGMGKSLELNIIAEGVETVEQLNFLRAQHCEEGQGFLFSKAVPAKDFAQLLQVGSPTLMPDQ